MNFQIDKKMLKNRIRDKEKFYRELLSIIGGLFKTTLPLKYLERVEKSMVSEKKEKDELPLAKSLTDRTKIPPEKPIINK
jgi:hypothetical protein